MKKVYLALLVMALSCSSLVFAKKGVEEERSLGAENSWQEKFDINDKKPGKYNIYVTAEDNAGNVAMEGPFNIFIDPESDLPVCGITNPSNNQRVPGNLNIVGTCVDDDKVSEVWLILDDDVDNPVKAEGTEYWSYFLSTTDLLEGPHTIEVYGVDNGNPEAYKDENGNIDESKVIPKKGHSVKVTWNLDRRQPVTEVLNMSMGQLVSGKINLKGKVTDGNSISRLEYSLDGGVRFDIAKITEVKYKSRDENGLLSEFQFDIPIDTTKFKDGAATCWFKATDGAGSVGRYAFLYFIDNSAPDVKIVTPLENDPQNGIFTVAGYAKDTIGLSTLMWKWGGQTGEFELTPGNPYWVKEVDSRNIVHTKENEKDKGDKKKGKDKGKDKNKGKGEPFTIIAVDTIGNQTIVTKNILIDQEKDKPVVKIEYPKNGLVVEGDTGSMFIRGIALDDDGVVSLTYKVDSGEERTIDCTGVFHIPLEQEFEYGSHTVTMYATDKYGVKGNIFQSNFTAKGKAPSFSNAMYKASGISDNLTDGYEIHPESDGNIEVKINSACGLSSVDYEVLWGQDKSIKSRLSLSKSGATDFVAKIPVSGDDFPWGTSRVVVNAYDSYGRKSTFSNLVKLTDITDIYSKEAGVFFNDSIIKDDGTVVVAKDQVISGYFAGGAISSVTVTPAQKGVSANYNGHVIIVNADVPSGEFTVDVTTEKGAKYSSRKIKFVQAPEFPEITLDENSDYDSERGLPFLYESPDSVLSISGKVSDRSVKVKYHILAVSASFDSNGFLVSSSPAPESEFHDVNVAKDSSWSIKDLNFDSFVEGMSVVEIIAENDGLTASQAVFVRKIPYAPLEVLDEKGKPLTYAGPALYWLKGHDYYGVCVYQGSVDNEVKYVRSSKIPVGTPAMTFSVSTIESDPKKKSETVKSPSVNVNPVSNMSGEFLSIDGETYRSGMNLLMERGATKNVLHRAVIKFNANGPLKNVAYEITGDKTPGGEDRVTGSANLRELFSDPENAVFEYEAEIPLGNLPARINTLKATATDAGNNTFVVTGSFTVVRNHNVIDNEERIYWANTNGVRYDADKGIYILNKDTPLTAFANVVGPVSAELTYAVPGLRVETEGTVVKVYADRDGLYKNVAVRVVSKDGASLRSKEVSILSDSVDPVIKLVKPETLKYCKSKIYANGSVSDETGIASLAYTMQELAPARYDTNGTRLEDDEVEWTDVHVTKSGEFETNIDVDAMPDGYIPVTFRAIDNSGRRSYSAVVMQKDVTSPVVQVIIPDNNAIVNGENTIAFLVKDLSPVKDITYQSADGKKTEHFEIFLKPDMVPEMTVENAEGELVAVSDRLNPLKTLNSSMPNLRIGTKDRPIDNGMKFIFTDANGNKTEVSSYGFKVDEESDKPIVEIHLPEELQVITRDFTISGVVYDDDGPCQLYYKLDEGEYHLISEEYSSSYKINVPINIMTDNEHKVTVYAVDINGVKGPETVRNFRISLEEPKGGMTEPEITSTVKETVTLRGWASDKNGISKVQISVDNGSTFNDAEGTEEWSYKFDSRVIQDGTHVVFIKIYDGYEITGLYSSLINIDNTPPDLKLDLPLDDSKSSKTLFFSGQTTDNIKLTSLSITMRSLEGKKIPEELAHRTLVPDEIITQVVDISSLENGFYNVELTGTDAAGNITRVSRNIELDKKRPLAKVSMLYPLNGEHVRGDFNIYGMGYGERSDPIEYVNIYIDSQKVEQIGNVQLTSSGYFKIPIKSDYGTIPVETVDENGETVVTQVGGSMDITEGLHTYQTIAVTKSGRRILSNLQTFIYSKYGPWVTLENFTYGDFARDRPLLKGKAGYTLTDTEISELKSKETFRDRREVLEAKKLKRILLSFDNGKTYTTVSKPGQSTWEYRVENLDIPAGIHFMLIKAEMMNGENAITRTIVQVDRTNPSIRLISPGEGGRYNQQLSFEGLTGDDIDLSNVSLALRQGDKANYEVPGFIQGLYFDTSFWGASLYSIGVGITAFDGAVKVQASYGQMTQSQYDAMNSLFGKGSSKYRFGGDIIGAKIIAQLAYIPFRYFFGRDWDWLSATFSVGANFSYFTDSGATSSDGSKVAQMLSAALCQIEFPRFTFAKNKYFKTWAIYTEPQLWFIPSDVSSDAAKKMVFTCSIGGRASLF